MTAPLGFNIAQPLAPKAQAKPAGIAPTTSADSFSSIRFGANTEKAKEKPNFLTRVFETVKNGVLSVLNFFFSMIGIDWFAPKVAEKPTAKPQPSISEPQQITLIELPANTSEATESSSEDAPAFPGISDENALTMIQLHTYWLEAEQQQQAHPELTDHIQGTLNARLEILNNGSADKLTDEIALISEVLAGKRDELLLLDKPTDDTLGPSGAETTGLEAYRKALQFVLTNQKPA